MLMHFDPFSELAEEMSGGAARAPRLSVPGSVRSGEHELEELPLDRDETAAAIEAAGAPVGLLGDDPEGVCALGDRIALGVREQPVSDPALLVARCDEELLDDDGGRLRLAPQCDVACGLDALPRPLAGDEHEVVLEHLEHPSVAPPGYIPERRPGEVVQPGQLPFGWRRDLHARRCHSSSPFLGNVGLRTTQLDARHIGQALGAVVTTAP